MLFQTSIKSKYKKFYKRTGDLTIDSKFKMNKTERVFGGGFQSDFCCVRRRQKRGYGGISGSIGLSVESRFGGLVANVYKQQCQLCRQEGKRSRAKLNVKERI